MDLEISSMAAMANTNLGAVRLGSSEWHHKISSAFGRVDLRLGDEARFSGSIEHGAFAAVDLARADSAYEDATRNRRHVSSDTRESYVIVMPLLGKLNLYQHGRDCVIGAGEFSLFDLNAPHRYIHSDPLSALSIRVPSALLRSCVRRIDDLVATRLPAERGVARITRDFAGSLLQEANQLTGPMCVSYGARLGDMIGIMLDALHTDTPVEPRSIRDAVRERCVRLIDANLGDPSLRPETLARRCGVSVRYLHKVFQDGDATLAETIRNRRLELCRERLALHGNPMPIKEVALSAGFKSASHFSNAFKAKFGLSPLALRRGPPNA